MKPINAISPNEVSSVRYVLHDIDDTITDDGKLLPEAYEALWALSRAGFKVIPVTGRPAGWCDLILRQWPVAAVVGENGAFVDYFDGSSRTRFFHPSVPQEQLTERLREIGNACLKAVPGCRISKDQPYRVCDLAIDFNEDEPKLGFAAAEKIKQVCESFGAVAKISSIHVNTWFGDYDKVSMARLFLEQVMGEQELEKKVAFFGDSPNDEPMFRFFPLSIGVANLRPFLPSLTYKPAYLTLCRGGRGFAEGVQLLLSAQGYESTGCF
ncbi:MAG: HAD-IIB family hydrolase [Oscillospiraceae bacterium]|nr:HAD-IIB family hydrolase [Oscillospiraceae bacterium]